MFLTGTIPNKQEDTGIKHLYEQKKSEQANYKVNNNFSPVDLRVLLAIYNWRSSVFLRNCNIIFFISVNRKSTRNIHLSLFLIGQRQLRWNNAGGVT